MRRKDLSNEKIQQVLDIYNSGEPIKVVVDKCGLTYSIVRAILLDEGVMRSKSDAAQQRLETYGHPGKGKQRSLATRMKIAEGRAKAWTPEKRKEFQEIAKKNWEKRSPEDKAKMKKNAIAGIQKAGKEGSKLEKLLCQYLVDAGYEIEFHKQYLLEEKLEVDIIVKDLNLAIEIDGISHFEPVWGEEKLESQQNADRKKYGILLNSGLNILRVKIHLKRVPRMLKHKICERTIELINSGINSGITELDIDENF